MLFERLRRQVKWIVLVVAVAFAVTLLYVGGPAIFSGRRPTPIVVARVNGEVIGQDLFEQAVANQMRVFEQTRGMVRPTDLEEVRYQALNRLVNTRLLLQAARDQRVRVERREVDRRLQEIEDAFPSEREFRRELERSRLTERDLRQAIEEGLMVEKLRELVTRDVSVTDEEVARAYEQVRLRQILVRPEGSSEQAWRRAQEQAQALYRRLEQGADFQRLAESESDDEATRDEGGELGFVGRGLLPEPLEQAAFALPVGGFSEPVRTALGYHILQVVERREPQGEAFEESRDEVAEQLRREKADEAFLRWFEDLRRQAAVEIEDPQMAARDALGRGELQEALAGYQRALELAPEDAYVHYGLARVLGAMGRQEEALQHLIRAVDLEANDPILHFELGNAYRQQGEVEKAVASLRKASQLAPMDLQMHLMLYAIFSSMGRREEALQEQRELEKIQQVLEEQRRLQEEFARRLQQQEAASGQPGQGAGQAPAESATPPQGSSTDR